MKKNSSPARRAAEKMALLMPEMFMAITSVESRLKRTIRPDEIMKSGPTPQQLRALSLIRASENQRMRPGELSRRLGLSPGTVSINAKRLIRDGYLVKLRDKSDERGVELALTAKAHRVFAEHRRLTISFFEKVFEALPLEKRWQLIESHRFIIETFHEVARR